MLYCPLDLPLHRMRKDFFFLFFFSVVVVVVLFPSLTISSPVIECSRHPRHLANAILSSTSLITKTKFHRARGIWWSSSRIIRRERERPKTSVKEKNELNDLSRWRTGSLCYLRRLIKSTQSCQRKNDPPLKNEKESIRFSKPHPGRSF